MSTSDEAAPPSPSPLDVYCIGPVFLDVALADLAAPPRPGTEVAAHSLVICPGGTATVAVAAARLGSRTGIATTVGTDRHGQDVLAFLAAEGVDTRHTAIREGLPTPLTVSIAADGDRMMVTHGAVPEPPPGPPPAAATVFTYLPPHGRAAGLEGVRESGAVVIGDTAWDPSEKRLAANLPDLALLDVFTPNAGEAMTLTHAGDPHEAARRLGRHVPVAVVTLGSGGVLAVDAAHGVEYRVPGIHTAAIDTLGAGEVFTAGLMTGLAREFGLHASLMLGVVAAGLAVRRNGGSASAPTSSDVAAWCESARQAGSREFDPLLALF